MLRRILVPVLALAMLAALAGTAAAKTVKTKAGPRYYLALGDSLSQGQQPNLKGVTSNTNEGYADDLYQTGSRACTACSWSSSAAAVRPRRA